MKVMDQSNHDLGELTSGTFSPTLREGIALALLESCVKVGDKVFVDVRGKNVEFLVTKPPFVESKVR
jgi:aminomethyltransferase